MTIILDGKKIANEIINEMKSNINLLDFKPGLGIIMVGTRSDSKLYVDMKQKKLAMFIAFAGMLLCGSVAYAGASITAAYKVVAVQANANGSVISLDVTVTNNGTVDLNTIVVDEIDPTHPGGLTNTLTVGALVIGSQAVRQWTINSSIPASQVPSQLALYFQGNATDANGNPVIVAVEGVAQ